MGRKEGKRMCEWVGGFGYGRIWEEMTREKERKKMKGERKGG